MLIYILSYIGGILTIMSPCVLPVIPFIFSRSDQSFRKKGIPMLVGMGISFSIFAALSVTGGHWIIEANRYGRIIALAIFFVFGLMLLWPKLSDLLSRPFVRLGNHLQQKAGTKESIGSSLLLGGAIGLLWTPCAGPILGLVFAGSAVGGSHVKTVGLLFVFAMGAATSLGVVIFASGKVLQSLKKSLGIEEWIRKGLGVVILIAVMTIGLGIDTRILSNISYFNTNPIEQKLVNQIAPSKVMLANQTTSDEGAIPPIAGAVAWINSDPLTTESLRGKVVLIDFWTYSCINCLRTLPYVKTWAEKYKDQGLVVIGIHTPEFAFEKDLTNVKKAVTDLDIHYPVAVDSKQIIWNSFQNQYWPAHYFVDAKGRIRGHHFGEGSYDDSEKLIQELLAELHQGKKTTASNDITNIDSRGVQKAPSINDILSHETYLGYGRQSGFSSTPGIKKDSVRLYNDQASLSLNQWNIQGSWKVNSELIELKSKTGKISYRFHARDVHLVLGSIDHPIRFQVTIDGKSPGEDHGEDTDANGNGVVNDHRLYQLVRQRQTNEDRTFTIQFLDRDVQAYAFTFG